MKDNIENNKIYSIQEIKKMINKILKKYNIDKAYIFGSYARGEATESSDIDIMIKKGNLTTLLELSKMAIEIEEKFKKNVDIVTEESYTDDIKHVQIPSIIRAKEIFYNEVCKERVLIYG